jgi:hypothetical protein
LDDDADLEDDGTAGSQALQDGKDEEGENEDDDVYVPEMEQGSEDAAELAVIVKLLVKVSFISASAAMTLTGLQTAWFAWKLQFSAGVRAGFKGVCAKLEVPSPHSICHDVKTRWNSTANMLADADRVFDAMYVPWCILYFIFTSAP